MNDNNIHNSLVQYDKNCIFVSHKKEINRISFVFTKYGYERVVEVVLEQILSSYSIKNKRMVESQVQKTLRRMLFCNNVFSEVFSLRNEPYDSSNPEHEVMLESLWDNLKPDVRRADGRYSKEWSEIGFQGTDPKTDFRSMGLLSLKQLVYFTSNYPIEARKILLDSSHNVRWYPFSVTGINITSFIIDLVKERLLDYRLYDCSSESVGDGVKVINEFYCNIFSKFNKFWVSSNPTDLMDFPRIFQELKDELREEAIQNSFIY